VLGVGVHAVPRHVGKVQVAGEGLDGRTFANAPRALERTNEPGFARGRGLGFAGSFGRLDGGGSFCSRGFVTHGSKGRKDLGSFALPHFEGVLRSGVVAGQRSALQVEV
jgi:hypothetical protein